jgi:flavin reductase (DIM6/NTAB) family NADH-FMN oxidoreductase RutF
VFRSSDEFVVSFPSASMEADLLYFGTVSGRDEDKLAATRTATQPAAEIDCVVLSEAVANFECVTEASVETGDHVLFVGRVVAAHVNTDSGARRLMNFGQGRFGDALPAP